MKNSSPKFHRLLLPVLLGIVGLWGSSPLAAILHQINDQPTLYFIPEGKKSYNANHRHTHINFEALTESQRPDPNTPSYFSPHWRMGIANHSCFFEIQMTGHCYEYLRINDDSREELKLKPFGEHYRQILAAPALMGRNVDDGLIRLDRQWWSPSSHYTLQHWNLAAGNRFARRITLDFGAMASVLKDQSVAVRLWGAEWTHPWDDAGRNAPHVRSLPNNFVL
ncbi:MAG: hypothetical protein LBD54_01595, partial [Puniceicoccales bacterium]|nr:hypothetical protein [Puniceicoccales bacterium]